MFELYKMEVPSLNLNDNIKRLLHLLKHLAFVSNEGQSTTNDLVHQERQAKMFIRIYHNHFLPLLSSNSDKLEVSKIEKVFKIVEFLINN